MISSIVSSRTARRPLAPVLRKVAFSAMAQTAASVNLSLVFSNSNNFLYCKKIIYPTKEEINNHKKYLKSNFKKNFFN